MSLFGFSEAVTTLGHHGTGVVHKFDIDVSDCTLQTVCDNIDDALVYLESVYIAMNKFSGLRNSIKNITKTLEGQTVKIDNLVAAVYDMKRELLRGNRDIRR